MVNLLKTLQNHWILQTPEQQESISQKFIHPNKKGVVDS